jgi:hypothetical protein
MWHLASRCMLTFPSFLAQPGWLGLRTYHTTKLKPTSRPSSTRIRSRIQQRGPLMLASYPALLAALACLACPPFFSRQPQRNNLHPHARQAHAVRWRRRGRAERTDSPRSELASPPGVWGLVHYSLPHYHHHHHHPRFNNIATMRIRGAEQNPVKVVHHFSDRPLPADALGATREHTGRHLTFLLRGTVLVVTSCAL